MSPTIAIPLNYFLPSNFTLSTQSSLVSRWTLLIFARVRSVSRRVASCRVRAGTFFASPPFSPERQTQMVGMVDTFGSSVVVSYYIPLYIANTFIGAVYGRVSACALGALACCL